MKANTPTYPFRLKNKPKREPYRADECAASRCRERATVEHLGVPLCDRHWRQYAMG